MIEPRTPSTEAATEWFLDRVAATVREGSRADRRTVLVERSARAGLMAPLTVRDEDETYRILEGRVTFFIGDEVIRASEGDVVVAPAGVARTFSAGPRGARWQVVTRVASLQRFEEFGRAVARPISGTLAGAWHGSESAAAVAAIGAPNGIDVIGPPGLLPAQAVLVR